MIESVSRRSMAIRHKFMRYIAKVCVLFVLFVVSHFLWTILRSNLSNAMISPERDLTREEGRLQFKPRVTFNNLKEWALYKNVNGMPSEIGMTIREGATGSGQAYWRDEDEDGMFEAEEALLVCPNSTRLSIRFSPSEPGGTVVTTLLSGNAEWQHRDIDGNGVIDASLCYRVSADIVKGYIYYELNVCQISIERPYNDGRCWAELAGRGLTEFAFREGHWEVLGETPQREIQRDS